jgi:hypothetical protein
MRTATLPQGHLDLIATDAARRLLASRELARLAYPAADGTLDFTSRFPGGGTAEEFAQWGRA